MNQRLTVRPQELASPINLRPPGKVLQRATVVTSSIEQVPPIVHDVLHSPGQPLDAATRTFMEPRLGHDFSNVRLHTDSKAQASAHAVGARAYAVGTDIVFASGQYAPDTNHGKRLLAHELTHVTQQSAVPTSALQIGAAASPLEAEADSSAAVLVNGLVPPQSTRASGQMLLRQEDESQRRPSGARQQTHPQVIVVPPPPAPPLQLPRPWLLGGERGRTPFGGTQGGSSGGLLLGGASGTSSTFSSLPSLTRPNLSQISQTQPAPQSPILFQPPAAQAATPAPRGVPVNTSVGTDVGFAPGEGHAVAEVSVQLTADWSAATWRLGRSRNWSLNFLDQPNAGVTISFNPQAGSPEEVASLSHQLGINALSLVLQREDDRILEIAATSGIQLDSSGQAAATVGGQVTYHPTDRLGVYINGNAQISRQGGQLVPQWGNFTMGIQFDIDQDKPAQRR